MVIMPYTRLVVMLALLVGSYTPPLAAVRQGSLLDQAVFVISRQGRVVGREEFSLRTGRQSGNDGFTMNATGYYPPSRARPTVMSVIELRPDSQPVRARFDMGPDQPLAFVVIDPRRVTVRTVSPTGESARQYPGSPRTLIRDEQLLTLFSFLPGTTGGSVTLLNPRSGEREVIELRDLGFESTDVDGESQRLRHVTLGSGDSERHLWYDAAGHLIKVAIPSQQLTAVRSQ